MTSTICPRPLSAHPTCRFQARPLGVTPTLLKHLALKYVRPALLPVHPQLQASAGYWFPHRLPPCVRLQKHLGLIFHDAAQEGTRETDGAGAQGLSRVSDKSLEREDGGLSRADAPPGGHGVPDCVRRRRPRLPARCEGGADGEEEGVGGGPRRCQIPGGRPHHLHGNGARRNAPSLQALSGLGNKSFGCPGRASVWTTTPNGLCA